MSQRRLRSCLRIALAWAVVSAGTTAVRAVGEEMALVENDVEISRRIAALEAEVQRLRELSATPFASFAAPAPPPTSPAPSYGPPVGRDFFNSSSRTGGLIGGAEAIFFKPFYSGAGAPNVDAAASNPFTGFVDYPQMQYNYTAAPRIWIGYVAANGLGGRFRFFDYHQNASSDVSVVFGAPPAFFNLLGSLALRTYDLELTQQVDFRAWSFQAYGGIRYAQALQRSTLDAVGTTVSDSALSFYGAGLTAGLQAERALSANRRWSLLVSSRGSMLYGHQRDNTSDQTFLYTEGNRHIDDAFASIWELKIGPQWKIRLPRGGEFFVRSSLEGQYWQGVGNFAPIGTSPDPGLNHNDYSGGFGLLGFGSAIGITR